MPGTTPLYNVTLQSSLNLNSQGLTGTTPAKRFVEKNIGAANKTVDASDMGRLLKFTGSRVLTFNSNISGVTAGDTFTVYSGSGMTYAGAATIINSLYENSSYGIAQLVYVGSNTWLIINAN